MRTADAPSGRYQPWFERRPGLALAGTAVMFAVVTALRVALGGDATVGVTMLYIVPVALVGLAWGRWAGLSAALVAVVLLALWVLVDDVELSVLGWASRVVPMLLSGVVIGDASDRLRRAESARLDQVSQELLRRQAVEVNDTLVQGMAAAKWALEAGRHDVAARTLDQTLATGQQLVSDLIRQSGTGHGTLGPPPKQ